MMLGYERPLVLELELCRLVAGKSHHSLLRVGRTAMAGERGRQQERLPSVRNEAL